MCSLYTNNFYFIVQLLWHCKCRKDVFPLKNEHASINSNGALESLFISTENNYNLFFSQINTILAICLYNK